MNTGYKKVSDPRLKRYIPKDWSHVEKHPLTASIIETVKPAPIVVGVNWYSAFDTPRKEKDGRFWVGKNSDRLGYVRGGHCICMPSNGKLDTWENYIYYNQGAEGACVGFGSSRAMSLLNKKLYNAWWLWDEAKLSDDFTDTNPGDENGSTVRAAMDVLRFKGHVAWNNNQAGLSVSDRDNLIANKSDGIVANKWATSVDDLFSVLQNPLYEKLEAIPFVNSWGTSYSWFTWVPCKIWERLLKEDGEMTMITDF